MLSGHVRTTGSLAVRVREGHFCLSLSNVFNITQAVSLTTRIENPVTPGSVTESQKEGARGRELDEGGASDRATARYIGAVGLGLHVVGFSIESRRVWDVLTLPWGIPRAPGPHHLSSMTTTRSLADSGSARDQSTPRITGRRGHTLGDLNSRKRLSRSEPLRRVLTGKGLARRVASRDGVPEQPPCCLSGVCTSGERSAMAERRGS